MVASRARKSKFAGAMELLEKKHSVAEPLGEQPRGVGRPKGKRSNPDYVRLTVLVPKDVRKRAVRKWEDERPDSDVSELVKMLLEQWSNDVTPK